MTNPDEHAWKPLTWSLIAFFLLVALFDFALDNTIMANVQPAIIRVLAVMLNGALTAQLGYYMPWYLDGGIALALTITNTIFLNKSTGRIAAILPQQPRNIIQQAIFGVRAEFFTSLSVVQRKRVVAAIISSVDDVFVLIIAAAALSVALALVMKWERLFVGFGSPQGDDAEVKEVKEGMI
ncbi:hypothetical protein CBS147352_2665 [Aspergillus niger]|nr:hypothetical protein CBS147352_2665 [Aspergillus niger]